MCKEAFREVAKDLVIDLLVEARDKGFDFDYLAKKVGISPKTLQHYLYGEQVPSLAVLVGLWQIVKPSKPLKFLAEKSGYAVVKLPVAHQISYADVSVLYKKTAMSMNELAKFMEKSGDIFFKRRIKKEDASLIKNQGWKVIELILEVMLISELLAEGGLSR